MFNDSKIRFLPVMSNLYVGLVANMAIEQTVNNINIKASFFFSSFFLTKQ